MAWLANPVDVGNATLPPRRAAVNAAIFGSEKGERFIQLVFDHPNAGCQQRLSLCSEARSLTFVPGVTGAENGLVSPGARWEKIRFQPLVHSVRHEQLVASLGFQPR